MKLRFAESEIQAWAKECDYGNTPKRSKRHNVAFEWDDSPSRGKETIARGGRVTIERYDELKPTCPRGILLIQTDDVCETFDNDARRAAKVLGLTLDKAHGRATGRARLAFPAEEIDDHRWKLSKAGYWVSISR